jgi:hypothetical protein
MKASVALFAAVVGAALASGSAAAAAPGAAVLVTSAETHSVEQFDTQGHWIQRFASAGSAAPFAIAQSPVSGVIFVSDWNSSTVLRYRPNATADANTTTFTVPASAGTGNPAAGLLFDPASGDLWLSTYIGTGDSTAPGFTAEIFRFTASSLTQANPTPVDTITPSPPLVRGGQLAFDGSGNVCMGAWANSEVLCFTPAAPHTMTTSGTIVGTQPSGLALGPGGQFFASDVNNGRLITVPTPLNGSGTATLFAQGLTPLLEFLTLQGSTLYVPSYGSQVDAGAQTSVVYAVAVSNGAVSDFIGPNGHVLGAYAMTFANLTTPAPALRPGGAGALAVLLLVVGVAFAQGARTRRRALRG